MRILVIEDDQMLADMLADMLRKSQFTVELAQDGESGLAMALEGTHDIVIIDRMLPNCDGLDICRAIRTGGVTVAILMLTGRSQVGDRVAGLESGADDYLVKPFAYAELLARLRALSRRQISAGDPNEMRWGDVVLNLRDHSAQRGDRELNLTTREWNLLEYLIHHPDQVLTRLQILNYVWPYEGDMEITMVDLYVSYLRRKLTVEGESELIQTVRGVGYRLGNN